MRILSGESAHPGVAIAVAALVDALSGFSGVPESVVRDGRRAIRAGLPESEQPEVVLLSDAPAFASMVRIPGARIVGIACRDTGEAPTPFDVPCVVGIGDLLKSASGGEIAILDGDRGVIHLEPQAETLVDYQAALESAVGEPLVIAPDEMRRSAVPGPASAAAVVRSIADVETAVTQNADRLLVLFDELVEREIELRPTALIDPDVELLGLVSTLRHGFPQSGDL